MPAPGEEHSLCGSVSVLSCAPPAPPLSLSACMIVSMKPPAVWLYVCLYPALTSLNSVVTAWSPGAPADREARDWHRGGDPASPPNSPLLRPRTSSFQAVPRAVLRPRRPARRPALGPAYPSGVCTPPHAASPATPPMPRPAGHTRARSPRVRRGAQWGGKPAPRRRRKPPSAVTRVSATRPSRYVRVPASARAPWGLSVGWGRWPLRLAPEGRTWHPSIHNFALSGKSSQRQVSTCSGRARAPPARARAAPGHSWPFCVTFSLSFPFSAKCEHVLERYSSCAERSTRRARISPVQLRLQCVASPCRSA